MTRAPLLCVFLGVLTACAGTAGRDTAIGYDRTTPPEEPAAKQEEAPEVPDDVVARAKGEVSIVRFPDKMPVSRREFLEELLDADAVCVGEQHGTPPHHYGELWLLDQSARQAKYLGLELGVGLEMFQQPYQTQLTAFQMSRLSEEDLLEKSEYEQRWGFPFAYYRPILEHASQLRLPLIALNARSELTHAVREKGIEKLDAGMRYELPELKLDDAQHRSDFERRMQGHPGAPSDLDYYYQAQVVWDETMATVAARWLEEHPPIRRLLIIAGQAHCQRSAIPERLERRGDFQAKAVLLATPSADLSRATDFDYALIVTPNQ